MASSLPITKLRVPPPPPLSMAAAQLGAEFPEHRVPCNIVSVWTVDDFLFQTSGSKQHSCQAPPSGPLPDAKSQGDRNRASTIPYPVLYQPALKRRMTMDTKIHVEEDADSQKSPSAWPRSLTRVPSPTLPKSLKKITWRSRDLLVAGNSSSYAILGWCEAPQQSTANPRENTTSLL